MWQEENAGEVTIQSNELTRVSSALSFIGGVHIGARALLDPKLIWFVYHTRLSQCGGGG
jgi:hypothetical protein